MKVHILATCRNPNLWHATELVFKSLDVGFPTADIRVHCNRLTPDQQDKLFNVTTRGVRWEPVDTDHWSFIKALVLNEWDPFWICDTDIVFWKSMEAWRFSCPLAGRFMPRFNEEFTGAIAQQRLHTSLLYVDPERVRQQILKYHQETRSSWFTIHPDLFTPLIIPRNGVRLFYDTAAMLYHAIGGEAFSDQVLDCYDHLHGACSADIIGPHMTDGQKEEHDRMACENPELIRGSWRSHNEYFRSRSA